MRLHQKLKQGWTHALAAALVVVALAILPGCGSLSQPRLNDAGTVVFEAAPSPTASVRTGGKPAAAVQSATRVVETNGAAATAVRDRRSPAVTEEQDDTVTEESTAESVTATATALAPTEGRWIDVDVTNFVVRLMDGTSAMRTIEPVAVGVEVNTGNFASTQTGLFNVYNKLEGLQYDAPYDAYISNWVGFDIDKQNGFHSFLQDKDGKDLNSATGRVSNGCIRTSAASEIFAFAEIGMPVLVHE